MYRYDQELYFRAVSFFRKKLLSLDEKTPVKQLFKNSGRTMPSIIRPDEEIVLLSSYTAQDTICFLTGILCLEEYNDLAISEVLDHFLRLARKNQYTGKWMFYRHLIDYFKISEESEFKVNNKGPVVFSLPEYFEFLEAHFSEDDIFGNVLNRGVSLVKNLRLRKRKFPADDKKVKYPQRHRGYRDKGSSADLKYGFRQGTNRFRNKAFLSESERNPKYSSLDQCCIFEKPQPKEE